jgi:hypothetical protein
MMSVKAIVLNITLETPSDVRELYELLEYALRFAEPEKEVTQKWIMFTDQLAHDILPKLTRKV